MKRSDVSHKQHLGRVVQHPGHPSRARLHRKRSVHPLPRGKRYRLPESSDVAAFDGRNLHRGGVGDGNPRVIVQNEHASVRVPGRDGMLDSRAYRVHDLRGGGDGQEGVVPNIWERVYGV